MFWDQQFLFQEYGNLFATKFPNVEIEVANIEAIYNDPTLTPDQAFQKFLDQQKPDVLMLPSDLFGMLAGEGKLFALDPVIKQDEFNTEGMHPAILQMLRDKGNGKLYGLSPNYTSMALFYNIDLFKKYGVDLPKDSMSWEEVFELAARFPTEGSPDTRIYGFAPDTYMTLDNLIVTVGSAEGLKSLNANATEVTMNTESWKKVFQSTLDAVKTGSIYVPTDKDSEFPINSMEDMYRNNLFITGRAAMSFNYIYLVRNIVQAKNVLSDVSPVNWGVVTAPVDPNNRNQSSYFSLSNIFAVNAASLNPRVSWELVKYINSEEFAKIKSKSAGGNLLTWTAFNADQDGRKLEPFYKLDPRPDAAWEYGAVPPPYYSAFVNVLKSELDEIVTGKKTIDEALKTIQERAQEELVKAKKAMEAAKP